MQCAIVGWISDLQMFSENIHLMNFFFLFSEFCELESKKMSEDQIEVSYNFWQFF